MIIRLLLLAAVLFPASVFSEALPDTDPDLSARARMVQEQIRARGVSAPQVLEAMLNVPRHWFVPENRRSQAYDDHPLPIGEGQTISQPYVVALMTEVLDLKRTDRVLEIGTGSGYQAAVLSAIASEVYTIEIKEALYTGASRLLKRLGYEGIRCRHGDGYFGWEQAAPFDAVMITAAVDHIPPPLIRQLADGGRMVLPLGSPFGYQNLVLVSKRGQEVSVRQITGVLFVPMTGHAMERR